MHISFIFGGSERSVITFILIYWLFSSLLVINFVDEIEYQHQADRQGTAQFSRKRAHEFYASTAAFVAESLPCRWII